MNINYKEFCESVFNTEVEKEKLNNVTLKILPISIINCSGYMIPNIKKSEYKIIINASNYSKLSFAFMYPISELLSSFVDVL